MRNMKAGWWFLLVLIGMSASLWAEEKKPANVDGKWKWTYKTKDGKDAEVYVKLKQDGERLGGAYVARDGKETPLENGKVNGDELTFDVNREMPAGKEMFHYVGKVSGETITGKIVFGNPKPTPHDWEATRVKE